MNAGVALCAVIALLALAVAPSAHVHELVSGGLLVHSHGSHTTEIEASADHPGTLDEGDHHAARTLTSTFVGTSKVEVAVPAAAVTTLNPPADAALVGRLFAGDDALIHGPPVRLAPPRAPPA